MPHCSKCGLPLTTKEVVRVKSKRLRFWMRRGTDLCRPCLLKMFETIKERYRSQGRTKALGKLEAVEKEIMEAAEKGIIEDPEAKGV